MSFTWDSVSSDTRKFNITERHVYNAPAYDMNGIEVPGRSGDILNPQNRFKNKVVTYTGYLRSKDFAGSTTYEKLSTGVTELKAWLLSNAGAYHELTDTYDPGYTRIGYISGETSIEEVENRPFGVTINVSFNCKPFMYGLAASDTTLTTSGGTITNPNKFDSLPLIKITMSSGGTLTVAGKTWTIGTYSGTLIVDSENMDWYDTNQLRNNLVTGTGFPVLKPGSNTISWTGGISKVVITPRWRTL